MLFYFVNMKEKKRQIFMEPSCKTHIYIKSFSFYIFFAIEIKILYFSILIFSLLIINLRRREEECLVPTAFWVLGLQFYLSLTLSISIYVFAFANESNIVAVLISFAG